MTTVANKGAGLRLRRNIAVAARWLHVYLSMVSFALIFFFAATGLTLNHPTWGASHVQTTETHGQAARNLLRTGGSDGTDRLGLVEMLRTQKRVHGAVTDFRVEDAQIAVSFRAPGYTADAFIDRDTGRYDLTTVESGWLAIANDLHKGSDTGGAWRRVIDAAAVLLLLVSLTGLVLVWFVAAKRRRLGLIVAALGAAGAAAVWGLALR